MAAGKDGHRRGNDFRFQSGNISRMFFEVI